MWLRGPNDLSVLLTWRSACRDKLLAVEYTFYDHQLHVPLSQRHSKDSSFIDIKKSVLSKNNKIYRKVNKSLVSDHKIQSTFLSILLRPSTMNHDLPNGDLISGFRSNIRIFYISCTLSTCPVHLFFFSLQPSTHAHSDALATGYVRRIACLLAHFSVNP